MRAGFFLRANSGQRQCRNCRANEYALSLAHADTDAFAYADIDAVAYSDAYSDAFAHARPAGGIHARVFGRIRWQRDRRERLELRNGAMAL